jgi:adenylylsulfate reductase subunit A
MGLDDSKWHCFCNSKYDPATGVTTVFKKPYVKIIPDA